MTDDFVPRASVRWLGPRGLAVTGYQVFLSGIFSRHADKRETQAALKLPQIIDRSDLDELWFDWLADTGDGFDASYATAALLGAPTQLHAPPHRRSRCPHDLLDRRAPRAAPMAVRVAVRA